MKIVTVSICMEFGMVTLLDMGFYFVRVFWISKTV